MITHYSYFRVFGRQECVHNLGGGVKTENLVGGMLEWMLGKFIVKM